ncbi:MAG: 5'-3' exonuclease H3TH domain-containing protein, partial [Pseudoflavonifractor sp.]
NIPRYELEGWEADDLIGTIAARDDAAGWETAIVTGDKDSLQLITDQTRVKLVTSRMGQTTTKNMTPAAFFETYGFTPEKMVDLKGLMGDASDNIPGVPGIGEKTAMELVQKYGTIADIYGDFDHVELKPAARRKMDEGRDMAKLSYDLATIHCDAPMDFAPEDALRRPVKAPELYDLFLKLEFSKLIDRFGLSAAENAPTQEEKTFTAECTSENLTDTARIPALLKEWEEAEYVAVLATPDLSVLAVQAGTAMTLVRADQLEGYNHLLRGLFSAKIKKISHNVKDLMNRLLGEGLSLDGFIFDTALAAYLLAPTDGSYDLERLATSYYNFQLRPAKDFL